MRRHAAVFYARLSARLCAWVGAWLLLPALAWAEPAPHAAPADPSHEYVGGHETPGGSIEWVTPIIGNDGNTGMLWSLLNFAVLMFILDRILFAPLRRRQAEKHDTIRSELDRATQARTEAEALVEEYRSKVARLDAEVDEILAASKKRAEADRASILAAAEREAEGIRAAARASAERDAEARRRAIEDEVLERAVARAETLLRERISPADQERMTQDYIGGIERMDIGGAA